MRARLLAQLAVNLGWTSTAESIALSDAALAMAERLDDRRSIIDALRSQQISRGGPDGVRERLDIGNRMVRIGLADADDSSTLWGHLWRFDAFLQLGEIANAEAELPGLDRLAQRLRSPLAAWHAVRARSVITLAYGDFERSSALGAELAFLARRSGSTVSSLGYLALLGAQTGRWSAASDERIDSVADGPPALLTLRASLLLKLGRRDTAEHLYRSMPPLASAPGFMLMSTLSAAALLAAEFDDRSLAADVHRRLHPYRDLFVTGGAGAVAVLGSARLHIGIAARTLGRFDEAVGHLRRAVEANDAAGMAPMATRARLELAVALARRARTGDRDEATALATSVAVQAGELGMEPLRLRSADLAAR